MSDKKSNQCKSNKKSNKSKIKCYQCEFYSHENDYCVERDIKNCTRQKNADFAKCDDFLIREDLVMF